MGSDSIPGFETNLRMALRASLSVGRPGDAGDDQNPPVVYARQANVTTGRSR